MKSFKSLVFTGLLLLSLTSFSQNPIIQDQYTADPTARVFNGKIYVFPSHDIFATEGKGRPGWFAMEDYHVFSCSNLTDWTDHGMIVDQKTVPWAVHDAYSMWAPDAVERNGKYYFYFPTRAQDTTLNGQGFSIGVAIADKPSGPYTPESAPIAGVKGIDPNVFIDKNGQPYLYWSQGHIYGAKLKENMLDLATEPVILEDLPQKGLKEGPFVFERNGIYYMTYPHVENKTERLEYATGDNPLGPFKFRGVIMDEWANGCWTNHHSIVNYKNQWYLFYHHNDLSPDFDKNRSIRMDSLFFDQDGSIQKVIPTLRGVGITQATDKIQLDRYSNKSDDLAIAFNNPDNTFEGWHLTFTEPEQWVQFNAVDFTKNLNNIKIQSKADKKAVLEVRMDDKSGPLLAKIDIDSSTDWTSSEAKLSKYKPGVHNLFVIIKSGNVEVDWLQCLKD
ncbi:family 43 glycosylhydrolase [Fulvivirga sediminis]|uniref:Family 43 glycosylhydrolase n=1 Tax=Fulvivirga sediminis TaxID=2803949 RepID=A0A937FB19_9BACT|nr:family 43 glycosylhydrolase [Fulvivirga sediminis]MBL3657198.1 family 43 glycosylhydrolase [Fulvivirga sediminis]